MALDICQKGKALKKSNPLMGFLEFSANILYMLSKTQIIALNMNTASIWMLVYLKHIKFIFLQ